MRKAVLILVVLTSMAYTTSAGAHIEHRSYSKMTAQQVAQYQLKIIGHDRWVIRTRKVHKPYAVWWHRQQLKWTLRELRETRAKMTPPTAHYRGWSCITHGARFNDTGYHEGNGYNGSYSGPLGMTDPWLGQSSPGSDWVHTPVSTVYAIAEKVAARYGFSDSFMRGQWPHTYPPCAGYF